MNYISPFGSAYAANYNITVNGIGNKTIAEGNQTGNYFSTIIGRANTIKTAPGNSYSPVHNTIIGQKNYINKTRNTVIGTFVCCVDPSVGAIGVGCGTTDMNRPWTYFYDIVKNSSTFTIKHPDPLKTETHQLIHTTVESPTAGDNMYRYQVTTINNKATLELPDYFSYLNKNEQVFITPKNHHGSAFGKISLDKKSVEITSDIDGDYQILIFATRKDANACRSWRGVEMISKGETLEI